MCIGKKRKIVIKCLPFLYINKTINYLKVCLNSMGFITMKINEICVKIRRGTC